MSPKVFLLLIAVAVIVAGLAGWFWIRRNQPAALSADSLVYPCLRIVDGGNWVRIDDSQSLKKMSSNQYMNRRDDPLVVDSHFQVFEMSKLKMQGSELGLLVTGPRPIEVAYELIARRDKSAQDARAMVLNLLSPQPTVPENQSAPVPESATLSELIKLLEAPAPDLDSR